MKDFLKHFDYLSLVTVTVMPAKEQVKDIIELITVEILQRVIGQFSRRIRNCIVARGGFHEKK